MKKLSSVIILSALLLSACGTPERPLKYRLDYISYEDEDADDNEYGLLGTDGVSFPKKFDNFITPVINGYFTESTDDGYSLYKINSDSYIEIASGLMDAGVMNDGLIPVCREGKHIQVLDESGDTRFTLAQIDSVDVWNCYSYSCGLMRVELTDDHYVFVDINGDKAFENTYEWATDFNNGVAVVGVGDNRYRLIDTTGETVVSFSCDDADEIKLSGACRKLAAKNDDGRFTIYDFDGNYTVLPKMVEGIYALLEDKFVFESDYNFGLMAYDNCKELIMAKYDRLVPNGNYFLAIHEDNDEIVKVIDETDTELASLDGEEIIFPQEFGYSYPNIIIRPDERMYLVDDMGHMLGSPQSYDIDSDVIKDASMTHNLYYPINDIVTEIVNLCGKGSGTPEGEGAFFYKNSTYCHTYEINYFRSASDLSRFKGNYSDRHIVGTGVNYRIYFTYRFDEPIVRESTDSLNRTAWLQYMEIEVQTPLMYDCIATYNSVKKNLIDRGCHTIFANSKGCILQSNDHDNLLIFHHNGMGFTIRMCLNSDSIISYWKGKLESEKYITIK